MRGRRSDDSTTDSGGWLQRPSTRDGERTTTRSKGLLDRIRGRAERRSSPGQETDSLDRARRESTAQPDDESGSWFGRARAKYGLGTLLVAAGVGLFLFPEPATSTIGIVCIVAGALLWLLG